MLEEISRGRANPNPTLIALKPRQVILAEHSKKTPMRKDDCCKTITLKPEQKALLLESVLRYLEHNCFSKSLKRLLSEAKIENDNWKTCSLDLEDIYCKFLETSGQADKNFNTHKKQVSLEDGTKKRDGDNNYAASEKTGSEKKKKKSNENDKSAAVNPSGAAKKFNEFSKSSEETLANDVVIESPKMISKSGDRVDRVSSEALKKPADDAVCESQMDDSTKKHKIKKKKNADRNVKQEQVDSLPGLTEKQSEDLASSKGDNKIDFEAEVKSKDKKKKNKQSTTSLVENVEQSNSECMQGAMAGKLIGDPVLEKTQDISLEKKKVKSKDKKRKNEDSVSEKLSGEATEMVEKEDPMVNNSTKECFNNSGDAKTKEKKGSKKRKRLTSGENECQHVEEVSIEEDSKRRKTEGLEEAKCKGQNGQVDCNTQKAYIEQPDKHANGKLEKNGGEKPALQKAMRKELNGSAEPKKLIPFQRVKVDDVEFADERLQDNSYWSKGGAEAGYGAKAQEVLGQVRGRDFRHEKTKKKRGSYRGGQIDLHSHSVKFNYSDDD